jgi:hypothetical protein
MLLSFSFDSRSILKSPVMTVSMFSLSTFWRKNSNLSSNFVFEFGSLYHVEINIGLVLGFFISSQIASILSRIKDFLSEYGIISHI